MPVRTPPPVLSLRVDGFQIEVARASRPSRGENFIARAFKGRRRTTVYWSKGYGERPTDAEVRKDFDVYLGRIERIKKQPSIPRTSIEVVGTKVGSKYRVDVFLDGKQLSTPRASKNKHEAVTLWRYDPQSAYRDETIVQMHKTLQAAMRKPEFDERAYMKKVATVRVDWTKEESEGLQSMHDLLSEAEAWRTQNTEARERLSENEIAQALAKGGRWVRAFNTNVVVTPSGKLVGVPKGIDTSKYKPGSPDAKTAVLKGKDAVKPPSKTAIKKMSKRKLKGQQGKLDRAIARAEKIAKAVDRDIAKVKDAKAQVDQALALKEARNPWKKHAGALYDVGAWATGNGYADRDDPGVSFGSEGFDGPAEKKAFIQLFEEFAYAWGWESSRPLPTKYLQLAKALRIAPKIQTLVQAGAADRDGDA